MSPIIDKAKRLLRLAAFVLGGPILLFLVSVVIDGSGT